VARMWEKLHLVTRGGLWDVNRLKAIVLNR